MRFSFFATMAATTAVLMLAPDAQAGDDVPPTSTAATDPHFRGSMIYRGTYTLKAVEKYRLSDENALVKFLEGTNKRNSEGIVNISLVFNGTAVDGTISGNGGIDNYKVSGVKNGDNCNLYSDDSTKFVGICNRLGFSGTIIRNDKIMKTAGTFVSSPIEVVDFDVRDREDAASKLAAERQAAASTLPRSTRTGTMVAANGNKPSSTSRMDQSSGDENVERAKLKAKLPKGATAKYTPLLEEAVQLDSSYWLMNRYHAGSIDLVMAKSDAQSGATFVKAYFSYEDGREGWVGAIIKNGKVLCVAFWDDADICRDIGKPSSRTFAAAALGVMASSSSSSSRTDCSFGTDCDFARYMDWRNGND